MGSWLNYGLGSESKNLPGYVVLTAGRGTSGGASNWSSGFLPTTYQGVLFRNQGEPVLNLNNPAGPHRRDAAGDDRGPSRPEPRTGTRTIGDPEINSRIAAYELAFRMQSAAPELIDLSGETQRDARRCTASDRDDPPKGGRGVGAAAAPGVFRQFAANCLLARRLVERGVRFVNLYHASWDHHSNLDRELGFNCRMADQPIAALLKDLKQRGLLDTTLVIWASEFGRTPLGENRPGFKTVTGRDHHPFAFSLWMAGGGVKGGQVIGKTDEIGWNVVEDPVHVNDFHATMLHLFGLDHMKADLPLPGPRLPPDRRRRQGGRQAAGLTRGRARVVDRHRPTIQSSGVRREASPSARGTERWQPSRPSRHPSTPGTRRTAAGWSSSAAGRCPSSTRRSSRSTRPSASASGSSTSATWAGSRSTAPTPSPGSSTSRPTTSPSSRTNQIQYSLMANGGGGLIDDVLVYRTRVRLRRWSATPRIGPTCSPSSNGTARRATPA